MPDQQHQWSQDDHHLTVKEEATPQEDPGDARTPALRRVRRRRDAEVSHTWTYPGARWWKFDFHTHNPASLDTYWAKTNDVELAPRDWLLQCRSLTEGPVLVLTETMHARDHEHEHQSGTRGEPDPGSSFGFGPTEETLVQSDGHRFMPRI